MQKYGYQITAMYILDLQTMTGNLLLRYVRNIDYCFIYYELGKEKSLISVKAITCFFCRYT